MLARGILWRPLRRAGRRLALQVDPLCGPRRSPPTSRVAENTAAAVIDTGPDRVDLALLKPLIQRCQLLITNDTGPRHVPAVALGVPVVVLMGPTDPRYTEMNLKKRAHPPGTRLHPVPRKVCPLGHHACMTAITPAQVIGECRQLLREVG